MPELDMFSLVSLDKIRLKNRLVRSATFEGMSDSGGHPLQSYSNLYETLSRHDIGAIITGFAYTSKTGRAMQPGQAGIDCDNKIPEFEKIVKKVHRSGTAFFMQISHAGRQTCRNMTGGRVVGVTNRKSPYFKEIPHELSTKEASEIAGEFAQAARRAMQAGFDGVQIHAAHGYLIHQFLSPFINTRRDRYAVDKSTGIGTAFLNEVIDSIRSLCGNDFPLLVKVSGSGDNLQKDGNGNFEQLISFLNAKKAAGIEVSCGTMDTALNIFRGKSIPFDRILDVNPFYKTHNAVYRAVWKRIAAPFLARRIRLFSPAYNMPHAIAAKRHTSLPVISVGGFRSGSEINSAIQNGYIDLAGMCRPFIAEPDFADRLHKNSACVSKCVSCNICSVMCDSGNPARCYLSSLENRS
jgi:2,4-dienoyl-CoA reductase-like NADH-dependent reductase (Old Yellow Enzyme family)